ncbi:unnamed protein product, partial [Tetraodon nigroviridis]
GLLQPGPRDARVGGSPCALRGGGPPPDALQLAAALRGRRPLLPDGAAAPGRGAEDGLLLVHSAPGYACPPPPAAATRPSRPSRANVLSLRPFPPQSRGCACSWP